VTHRSTRLRHFFQHTVLGNLWWALGGLLGLMQGVVGHWLLVVAAGRQGPGWGLALALALALVAANLALLPRLRRARQQGGWPRQAARAYTSVGIATLILGLAIASLWVGAVPAGLVLGWLGVSPQLAFELFRVVSAGVMLLLTTLLVWSFTAGARRIELTHTRIPVPGLHRSLSGLRLAQLSDLHIGNGMEGERLASLVQRVNHLQADVIVLTGDLFDFDPRFLEEGARGLQGLRARHGVYAVLGNHDAYTGSERVARALAEHAPGLRLLRGEFLRLPLAQPLYLAGVDDPGSGWAARDFEIAALAELAVVLPDDGPCVLLAHRPEAFLQASRLGIPLVLAGHTHGGQLALPLFESRLNLARLITRFDRGLFRENGSILYVNRGAGMAGPQMRIGSSREIAILELHAEA